MRARHPTLTLPQHDKPQATLYYGVPNPMRDADLVLG